PAAGLTHLEGHRWDVQIGHGSPSLSVRVRPTLTSHRGQSALVRPVFALSAGAREARDDAGAARSTSETRDPRIARLVFAIVVTLVAERVHRHRIAGGVLDLHALHHQGQRFAASDISEDRRSGTGADELVVVLLRSHPGPLGAVNDLVTE